MEDGVRVNVTDSSLVTPASPSPLPLMPLSPCDVMLRDYSYNRRVLFYRRPRAAGEGCELFISTLQSSLSQVLAVFYPFAGRLAEGEDGCLVVACNDQGAEFVQAGIHGVAFAELERSGFDMQAYYVHLTRWASYCRLHEGSAPLLSIQVTLFPCGGIALGIAHSHVVADGFSLWHFMSSWAECARGEPLSLVPSYDRTPLIIPNPSYEMAPIVCFEDDGAQKIDTRGKREDVKQRAFSFSKEVVDTLKERANNKYGSYEVLCAHIWKKVSKACGHGHNDRLSFGNVVNMRGRLDPPLPSGYFGNVLLWSIATATMGELQEEDLSSTASRIRGAVDSCSNSRMQQFLNFLELHGVSAFLPKIRGNPFRLRVSSSPKFPMMKIDFGWGRPCAIRSAILEGDGILVFYMGPSGVGSADMCIALPRHVMEHLESDTSFL